MTRTNQNPSVELHETDRSNYDSTVDNSVVGTATLVNGFFDQGEDYATTWVNSMDTLRKNYGVPTNDAETYSYNACAEVLNNGGVLYVSKLPYDNNSKDMISFSTYMVDDYVRKIASTYSILMEPVTDPSDDIIDGDLIASGEAGDGKLVLTNIHSLYSAVSAIATTLGYTHITSIDDGTDGTLVLGDIKSLYSAISAIAEKVGYEFDPGAKDDILPLTNVHSLYTAIAAIGKKAGFDTRIGTTEISLVQELVGMETITGMITTPVTLHSILADDLVEFVRTSTAFTYPEMTNYRSVFLSDGKAVSNTLAIFRSIYAGTLPDGMDAGTFEAIIDAFPTFYDLLERFAKTVHAVRAIETYNDILSQADPSDRPGIVDLLDGVVKMLKNGYGSDPDKYSIFADLGNVDSSITSVVHIRSCPVLSGTTDVDGGAYSGMVPLDTFDRLKTGELKVPKNQIRIFDISRSQYNRDRNVEPTAENANEYLGILPVITTAANALAFQGTISNPVNFGRDFNPLAAIQTVWNADTDMNMKPVSDTNLAVPLSNKNPAIWTTGKEALSYFPKIITVGGGALDRTYLKQIGIVVFRMQVDTSSSNLVRLVPMESFVGSLDPRAKDPITKANIYIGDVVNNRSNLINVFTNVRFTRPEDHEKTACDRASIYNISNQTATSLGFFATDRIKHISVKNSILDPLDRIFENGKNPDTLDLDLVLDAGVSNIAQFIASTKVSSNRSDRTRRKGFFEIVGDDSVLFNPRSPDASVVWRMVVEKYKNFCQTVRKDCMFICDGLRNICLTGNLKVVRRTKPENTIDNSILPFIKNISGINTSYGAGYCNWFWTLDAWTGDYFWCPPSIKAVGRYLYTDTYASYWLAPAGLNRGVMRDVVDVAFSMDDEQAGFVYGNSWNYATNYPVDGIAIEGQRTFQIDKTALDRVNVRRLMLGLEKNIKRVSKFYLYEGLTDWTVQRFRDAVTRVLEEVQDRGGILDFALICDDSNNSVETVERQELHATIAVRPIKSIEWILINLVSTSQGAVVEEVARANL